jgi:hypothetical protein
MGTATATAPKIRNEMQLFQWLLEISRFPNWKAKPVWVGDRFPESAITRTIELNPDDLLRQWRVIIPKDQWGSFNPTAFTMPDLAVILGLCKWTDLISRIVKRPKGYFDRRFYHNKPEQVRAGRQVQYLANLPRLRVYPFSSDCSYTVMPLTGSSEYLSSEWDRSVSLKWEQKRTYQKSMFPVRISLEKRFHEDIDGNPVRIHDEWEFKRQKDVEETKAPRHTAEECRVWNRKRNHKWPRGWWKIKNNTPKGLGVPEPQLTSQPVELLKEQNLERALWKEMSATSPHTPEWSKALMEWRHSLGRRSIDAAGLKL